MSHQKPNNQPSPPPSVSSLHDFSARYTISLPTVFRMIRAGTIEARKIGHRTIITREAEQAWLATLPKAGV